MKKRQVLSALIAGTLAAMAFTGCGEDGKIPQDNNTNNSSNPVSDMVSDAGDGIGDVVSDVGEGLSDVGEDVSDGVSDMTDGSNHKNDKENDNSSKKDESSWLDKNSSNDGVNDPALNDDSVSALEPVETQKKTLA